MDRENAEHFGSAAVVVKREVISLVSTRPLFQGLFFPELLCYRECSRRHGQLSTIFVCFFGNELISGLVAMTTSSLAKNLKAVTCLAPRSVITWDRAERVRRNKEIWDNSDSIVHRLPLHYKKRYWEVRTFSSCYYEESDSTLLDFSTVLHSWKKWLVVITCLFGTLRTGLIKCEVPLPLISLEEVGGNRPTSYHGCVQCLFEVPVKSEDPFWQKCYYIEF